MNRIFAVADVGKKNVAVGIALFLMLGVVVGIPLTINFLGGSILASGEYQTWKVVYGHGIFLAFINYFLGFAIDGFALPRQQKKIISWSFLLAGLIGGVGRMTLILMSSLNALGIYASLAETALFVLGTAVFVQGQMRQRSELKDEMNKNSNLRRPGHRPTDEKLSGSRGWSLE